MRFLEIFILMSWKLHSIFLGFFFELNYWILKAHLQNFLSFFKNFIGYKAIFVNSKHAYFCPSTAPHQQTRGPQPNIIRNTPNSYPPNMVTTSNEVFYPQQIHAAPLQTPVIPAAAPPAAGMLKCFEFWDEKADLLSLNARVSATIQLNHTLFDYSLRQLLLRFWKPLWK